jgi:hypothetical protein
MRLHRQSTQSCQNGGPEAIQSKLVQFVSIQEVSNLIACTHVSDARMTDRPRIDNLRAESRKLHLAGRDAGIIQ